MSVFRYQPTPRGQYVVQHLVVRDKSDPLVQWEEIATVAHEYEAIDLVKQLESEDF